MELNKHHRKDTLFYFFNDKRGINLCSHMTQWGRVNKRSNISVVSYYIDIDNCDTKPFGKHFPRHVCVWHLKGRFQSNYALVNYLHFKSRLYILLGPIGYYSYLKFILLVFLIINFQFLINNVI